MPIVYYDMGHKIYFEINIKHLQFPMPPLHTHILLNYALDDN